MVNVKATRLKFDIATVRRADPQAFDAALARKQLKIGDSVKLGAQEYKVVGKDKEISLESADGTQVRVDELADFLSIKIDIVNGVPTPLIGKLDAELMKNAESPQQSQVANDIVLKAKEYPAVKRAVQVSAANKVVFESLGPKPVEISTVELPPVIVNKATKVNQNLENIADAGDAKKVEAEAKELMDELKELEDALNLGPNAQDNVISQAAVAKPEAISLSPEAQTTIDLPPQTEVVPLEKLDAAATDLKQRADKAPNLAPAVKDILNVTNKPFWTKRKKVVAGLVTAFGAATGAALGAYFYQKAVEANNARAALEHQKTINGCFVYDKFKGTTTKIKLLSCGHYDFGPVMETCATQSWSSANASETITECPDNTFNPCTSDSKSRSSDTSVPIVPNVCDKYLYKSPAPAAIAGVTTLDACKNLEGDDLKETEACSVYCKTENFNLPPYMELLCVSVDYPTAYCDLMISLGFDANAIFPPQNAKSASSTAASKPLMIAAGILGGIFLLLLVVFFVYK